MADVLSPSETVFFHAETYEGISPRTKRFLGAKIPLLHTDKTVSAVDAGLAVLTTALLANERAGAVRLEVREKKELLGLRKVDTVYVEPTGTTVAWPAGSLESRLADAVARSKTREADSVFEGLLGADSTDPWQRAVELVKEGLNGRGLLTQVERRKLKIFKSYHWELPDATREIAREADAKGVRDLVEATKASRPEIWDILVREVRQAVARRTESDDRMDWD